MPSVLTCSGPSMCFVISWGPPLRDTPGPACASWASSIFCALSEALSDNGRRGGESDLSESERGELGGESDDEAGCRPRRSSDELDELALAAPENADRPPLLLVCPGGDGVSCRAMPEVEALDDAASGLCVERSAPRSSGVLIEPG